MEYVSTKHLIHKHGYLAYIAYKSTVEFGVGMGNYILLNIFGCDYSSTS